MTKRRVLTYGVRFNRLLWGNLLQFFSCQHLISLQVFVNRLLHDIIRQRPVVIRILFEPVAGELFVKGRLAVSRLISVSRPETGAVRCEHLVAQNDIAVFVQTEFELGICDNDTAAQGIIRAFFVKGDSVVAELGSVFFPFARECLFKMSNALLVGNIFVMVADLSLCGRCIDGFRQFIGFFETFRQADAAYSAVFLDRKSVV